jgi:hypothetical protein
LVSKALDPSHDYKRFGANIEHLLKKENKAVVFTVLWELVSSGWLIVVDGCYLFFSHLSEKLDAFSTYKQQRNVTVALFNKEQALSSKSRYAVLGTFVENHPEIFGV